MFDYCSITRSARAALFALAVCSALGVPNHAAAAHPLIIKARRLNQDADFAGALDVLVRATEARDLVRDDVVQLLVERSLAHLALGEEQAMRNDLLQLATLAPDYSFGSSTPPDLRDAFVSARTRAAKKLSVSTDLRPLAVGISIHATVSGDPASLVRATRIHQRTHGGEWTSVDNAPAVVSARGGQRVEYYAEALGPGGAVLVSSGSRASPLRLGSAQSAASADSTEGNSGGFPWVWVGVGAGVALVAVGVAIFLIGRGDDGDTQPGHPMIEF